MRPDDGTVDHVPPTIRLRQLRQSLQNRVPDAGQGPTSKALIDAVPLAVLGRKLPPLRPGAGYPQHALEIWPIVVRRAAVPTTLGRQKWRNHRPFFVRYSDPILHRFTSSQDESLNQNKSQSSSFVNRT